MATTYADMVYPALPFAALCLATTAIAYRLPVFSALDHQKRLFCALCCGALVNCSTVSYPGVKALYDMLMTTGYTYECGGKAPNLMELQAPSGAVLACGLTCGFFLQDSLILLLFPKETAKELGGTSAYYIMWMHHVVSMIVWPYSFVNNTSSIFVVYFIATEVTNVGQNLFLLAQRGNIFGPGKDLPIGIAWALSFFVVRVLPVPAVLYAWARLHLGIAGCGCTTAEWLVSLVTVPIPIALNLFWFYKIVSKARRMLGKPKSKGK